MTSRRSAKAPKPHGRGLTDDSYQSQFADIRYTRLSPGGPTAARVRESDGGVMFLQPRPTVDRISGGGDACAYLAESLMIADSHANQLIRLARGALSSAKQERHV